MSAIDYKELIRQFEVQRAKRQEEFRMEMEGLDETISGLRKMLRSQQGTRFPPEPQIETNQHEGGYAGISVRWAILNLLGEDELGPLPTSKIAEALKSGGITSSSQNFTSNVSAVVSDMTNKRGELEATDAGYRLTANGRAAWEAIRRTPQYLNRSIGIAS